MTVLCSVYRLTTWSQCRRTVINILRSICHPRWSNRSKKNVSCDVNQFLCCCLGVILKYLHLEDVPICTVGKMSLIYDLWFGFYLQNIPCYLSYSNLFRHGDNFTKLTNRDVGVLLKYLHRGDVFHNNIGRTAASKRAIKLLDIKVVLQSLKKGSSRQTINQAKSVTTFLEG